MSASTGAMRHQRRPGNNGGGAVENGYRFYIGIDWASEAHQVCVLDAARRIVSERSFAHAGDAVAAFAEWLNELAGDDPGGVAVAIEIPRGAVVETLVERGFHVYAINPKQLDRFRDRHSVAGAKDDRRDAFVLGGDIPPPGWRLVAHRHPTAQPARQAPQPGDRNQPPASLRPQPRAVCVSSASSGYCANTAFAA